MPEPQYAEYLCPYRRPLSCGEPQKTVQQESAAKFCMQCGFPAMLREGIELRGTRGVYRVLGLVGGRGAGRLYRGIQVQGNQPVVIKEFLLPKRSFAPEDARSRKEVFPRVGGLALADGRTQESRLIPPFEALVDPREERCFLVMLGERDLYPTLGSYLGIHGAWAQAQVYEALNQLLQTLEFLHSQKFRLPAGQVRQGLAHGNLSLESVLIAQEDATFFLYVCDPDLWERLFDPTLVVGVEPTLQQDLKALGFVAFYLAAGRAVDPASGRTLEPRDERNWPGIDRNLRLFILRLLEIEQPFTGVAQARAALRSLPKPQEEASPEVKPIAEESAEPVRSFPWLPTLAGLAVVLVGGLVWWFFPRSDSTPAYATLLPRIADVPAVPKGSFTYTAEPEGSWRYVARFKTPLNKDLSLEQELIGRRPEFKLSYQKPAENTTEATLETVEQERADFAIMDLIQDLPSDLKAEKVAYDGVLVFVDFSSQTRAKSLPRALGGKITFDQLRRLFTGQINNWRDLGLSDDLPVRLYIPTESVAVRVFEERVLKEGKQIATFRSLIGTKIKRLSTEEALREVRRDFENGRGGIGFGIVSKFYEQCGGYPLALVADRASAVQALVQNGQQPINPTMDLCKKGIYAPAVEAFREGTNMEPYPLGYPLGVVYPNDNNRDKPGKKFVDMLRTTEGQRLLSKSGLVPLQPLAPNGS
ncbi:substrate-binding domain-containing protein [Anthocerotibacter panamensis]|uniref:substrate-binding domain-containing protein n=1 Tax=Anthocerotibacter panamensis TaxID=2857077 RepID=UPI001C406973|nr:substrate-binding domain-containing protein [Anthocerotibacter panamensis]